MTVKVYDFIWKKHNLPPLFFFDSVPSHIAFFIRSVQVQPVALGSAHEHTKQ